MSSQHIFLLLSPRARSNHTPGMWGGKRHRAAGWEGGLEPEEELDLAGWGEGMQRCLGSCFPGSRGRKEGIREMDRERDTGGAGEGCLGWQGNEAQDGQGREGWMGWAWKGCTGKVFMGQEGEGCPRQLQAGPRDAQEPWALKEPLLSRG